ncbi:MAG: hypothetical protein P1U49_00485 [Minwuia sp.]|nr:hypothetical protein [Minwuia sp.]
MSREMSSLPPRDVVPFHVLLATSRQDGIAGEFGSVGCKRARFLRIIGDRAVQADLHIE